MQSNTPLSGLRGLVKIRKDGEPRLPQVVKRKADGGTREALVRGGLRRAWCA
jgi:hypothetical protein